MDRTPAEIDSLSVQIVGYFPGFDHRLRVAFGATDDCLDTRKKFPAIEWLAKIVVNTEAQTPNSTLRVVGACENQDRRVDPSKAQLPQSFLSFHIRQIQIEKNQVVIIELSKIDPFLTEDRRTDV